MAVPLILVSGVGVLAGLALVVHRVGWPATPAGEATLAVVGPVALLLGVLGGAGLLDALVDLTSPTLLPLALAYAALPGALLAVVGWAAAGAPPRQAGLVPVAGALVALAGVTVGHDLPIHDAAPGLIGLGFLLVAGPAPMAARDPRWTAPDRLPRSASYVVATLLVAVVVLVALVAAAFGAPQRADYRFELQVEAPDGAEPLRLRVPFLEASSPGSLAVRQELLTRLDQEGSQGSVGVGLEDGGRILKLDVARTSTARVGADLTLWGRVEHQSAFQGHHLADVNATATVVGDRDLAGNASVTWRYVARGNGCAVDATLEADVPLPGEAPLEGDVREDGGLEGGYCR